jgi:Coenzyme PQQ synthesis protein D (PqqD)
MEMSNQKELLLDSIITAATEQISCDLSGEAAILDLRSGVYYGLNQTGAFLWNQLKEPVSVRTVRDAMVDEFAVDAVHCERDLIRILTELVDRGLVEVKNEATR